MAKLNNSAVCTKQFCNYRDEGDKIEGLEAAVVGISPQDVSSHQGFIEENKIRFRNVKLLGLTFDDADSIQGAFAEAKENAAAA